MQANEGTKRRSRIASQPKSRRCGGCARSRRTDCRKRFSKIRRDEQMAAVRVPLCPAPPADDVDAAAAWRMSRWQHATPGAAAAACPRHKHFRAGCPRRSMCRQRVGRVNARTCICTSLARCATTAQLWNRWPRVPTMQPASTSVARRPSLYREQSPDDRRQHGSAYSSYTTTATRLNL